jgi:hypothetical protein
VVGPAATGPGGEGRCRRAAGATYHPGAGGPRRYPLSRGAASAIRSKSASACSRATAWRRAPLSMSRSEAGTVTPAARHCRARSYASFQTSRAIGSSGTTRSNSRRTLPLRAPRRRRSKAPAGRGDTRARRRREARPRRAPGPPRPRRASESESRRRCRSESSYFRRRLSPCSSTVIRSGQVPARFASSAMRRRRLNSTMAVTIASRLVRARVNLMASSSSPWGISTVVFMNIE